MNIATRPEATPETRAPRITALCRSRTDTAVVAVMLAIGLICGGAPAAAHDGSSADLPVGHRLERVVVLGAAQNELRQVDVDLWYPADPATALTRPKANYKSALHGKTLYSDLWDPLSWTVTAEIAREGVAIDPAGEPFPVIVFSHGATNNPIDYAHTLERIASAGFVVAAPGHRNNTQDDLLIDFINGRATAQIPPRDPLFPCNDGRPAPCARASVPFSMADRDRDIFKVLDKLPAWFAGRVDVERAGVMGHSRGTVTALAAAGGSARSSSPPAVNCAPVPAEYCWPLQREPLVQPRVKAVMGMAIGAPTITSGVDLANVTVPTLLVRGMKDTNSRPEVSEFAFDRISSADKVLVDLPNATHRSFDSTYCAQMQSAGAAFDTDGDRVVEVSEVTSTRPILDRQTIELIGASPPMFLSGKAVHYCAEGYFTGPVDIRRLVAATLNSEYACDATSCAIVPPVAGPSVCETSSIPCTGLDTEEVKIGMAQIAVAFFDSALKRRGGEGMHFTRYLAPKWLTAHVPMVGHVEAHAGPAAICPPGQGVVCARRAAGDTPSP